MATHFGRILRSDICLCQYHQVVEIFAGVGDHPSHSRVGYSIFADALRPHVQPHELLDIFHLFIHRHLHLAEDPTYHFLSHKVVIVEGPSQFFVISLGLRLADVMEQCCPSEPFVVAMCRHVVDHLKGVVEVVFMAFALHDFHPLQLAEHREDQLQEPTLVEKPESDRRTCRSHDLPQFVVDPLACDDRYPLAIAPNSLKGLGIDLEVELGGKADGSHHPQRVVAEGDVRIKWCANDPLMQVGYAAKRVDQFAISL